VVGLRQDADGVEVDVRAEDGTTRTRRAAYLVGADGVRSAVRQALGLSFPGRAVVRSLMLADVRLDDAPTEVLTANATGDALAFVAPFGDGWYRVIAWDRRRQLPDDASVDFAELREVIRRALGSDFGMRDPHWTSRFHSDERQVARYRVGRVFLAGDAAHVHSPVGGLGMNTGLQDAANLGWKLAAAIAGWAPDGLLDSYHAERHPVGRSVLRTSGTALRLALLRPRALRALRTAAVRTALRVGPLVARATGTVSGIGIAYPAPLGAHRLAGRRAPDIPLAAAGRGPGRLYQALRAGRFVLLAPARDRAAARRYAGPWAERADWAERVDVAIPAGATETTMLVRPDGYVAWASDEADPKRRAEVLHEALTAWCGEPVRPLGLAPG
jgi:flavin-dependent dehydrogenase